MRTSDDDFRKTVLVKTELQAGLDVQPDNAAHTAECAGNADPANHEFVRVRRGREITDQGFESHAASAAKTEASTNDFRDLRVKPSRRLSDIQPSSRSNGDGVGRAQSANGFSRSVQGVNSKLVIHQAFEATCMSSNCFRNSPSDLQFSGVYHWHQ